MSNGSRGERRGDRVAEDRRSRVPTAGAGRSGLAGDQPRRHRHTPRSARSPPSPGTRPARSPTTSDQGRHPAVGAGAGRQRDQASASSGCPTTCTLLTRCATRCREALPSTIVGRSSSRSTSTSGPGPSTSRRCARSSTATTTSGATVVLDAGRGGQAGEGDRPIPLGRPTSPTSSSRSSTGSGCRASSTRSCSRTSASMHLLDAQLVALGAARRYLVRPRDPTPWRSPADGAHVPFHRAIRPRARPPRAHRRRTGPSAGAAVTSDAAEHVPGDTDGCAVSCGLRSIRRTRTPSSMVAAGVADDGEVLEVELRLGDEGLTLLAGDGRQGAALHRGGTGRGSGPTSHRHPTRPWRRQ